jgi:hypothetical protein
MNPASVLGGSVLQATFKHIVQHQALMFCHVCLLAVSSAIDSAVVMQVLLGHFSIKVGLQADVVGWCVIFFS